MRTVVGIVILTLLATSASAQTSPYRLRPGDTLDISVWQEPKLNRQIVVAPDGRIALPLVGHLRAGGKTLEAIEATLRERLKKQYTQELDITVSLLAIKEKPPAPPKVEKEPPPSTIYVTGEVSKPGQFAIETPTNVLQAIALAGGLSEFAADRRIKIRRKINGQEHLFSFNYADFESGKNLSGNIRLRAGDVVIVPEKGIFE